MTSTSLFLARIGRSRLNDTQRRRVSNLRVVSEKGIATGVRVVVDREIDRKVGTSKPPLNYLVEGITSTGFVKLAGWPVAINPRRLTVVSDLGTK